MKLDHLAMYVNDLRGAKDFFVRYFEAKPSSAYHHVETKFSSYFLNFDDGSKLELMKRPGISDEPKTFNKMGYIHIAFGVDSKEKVDELTTRLIVDGYTVINHPRITGDGYYESDIIGFENNLIEINCKI